MNDISTVPVILDDMKTYSGFDMSRCIFFNIEFDGPPDLWWLDLENAQIPFMLIGLTGVIAGPLRPPDRELPPADFFDSVQSIDELFGVIEDRDGFYVATDYVWLPNRLLRNARGTSRPMDGEVFRVSARLFSLAYQYATDRVSLHSFVARSEDMPEDVHYSGFETRIFTEWTRRILTPRTTRGTM